jgi:hypothetical protein
LLTVGVSVAAESLNGVPHGIVDGVG